MAESAFTVSPPGLSGMVELGRFLDALKGKGTIGEWHPGRWESWRRERTTIGFDSAEDAAAATHHWRR